jgi:CRISPR-associated protein (TIGR02584 family)
MDPTQPHTYPRRILLAVTGLSPQVLTETLYALAADSQLGYVPTEVHLITTAEGAERARLSLLSAEPGWFARLCRDYGLTGVHFDRDAIHVLTDASGYPLSDIRTPHDNERAADFITDQVRTLTADPQASLHVSIAGGRKTLGFYLGYALSLYARPQDRLSHVLVPAPYESHPDFYYPPPSSRIIHTPPPDSRPLDAHEAQVTLAPIPFVRLRDGLPRALLAGGASFSATVEAAQRSLGPPALTLDATQRTLHAGGLTVELPPGRLAFYAWLALRCKAGEPPVATPKEGVPEPAYAEGYLAVYRILIGDLGDDERTTQALRHGMDKNYFERSKSAINKALEIALVQGAAPYLIQRSGRRPHWVHGLGLPPEAIELVGLDALARSSDGNRCATSWHTEEHSHTHDA